MDVDEQDAAAVAVWKSERGKASSGQAPDAVDRYVDREHIPSRCDDTILNSAREIVVAEDALFVQHQKFLGVD